MKVSSATALKSALSSARAGDFIVLADGTYNGRFRASAKGTQANPITLCGSPNAILSDATDGGYTLGPNGASWWVFRGFTIDRGLKGIMADRSYDNVYEYLTVKNIHGECVHMRNGSSRNIIRENYIHHCGMQDKNGEGIYFGSSTSSDQANDNQALNNLIEDTAADAIDVKASTRRSLVQGNTVRRSGKQRCALDGGDCASQGASAVFGGRPGNSTFRCNRIYPAADMRGIQIYSGGAAGDGDNNLFEYNWVTGGTGAVHSSQGTGNVQNQNTQAGYEARCG